MRAHVPQWRKALLELAVFDLVKCAAVLPVEAIVNDSERMEPG